MKPMTVANDQPPTPSDYERLLAALNSPPPTVIADWPEIVRPHGVDIEGFPPPTAIGEMEKCLRKVDARGPNIVMAITAAELAMANLDGTDAPFGAISAASALLREIFRMATGETRFSNLASCRVRVERMMRDAKNAGQWQAAHVLGCIFDCAHGVIHDDAFTARVCAARSAIHMAVATIANLQPFRWAGLIVPVLGRNLTANEESHVAARLDLWWRRCLCRLAVVDALTAEIEWQPSELPA